MVPLFAALLAVTLTPRDRVPSAAVWVDAGVIETGPGCFVCQMVLRALPGREILAVQELPIERSQKSVLDWYEREGRARIGYRLSCAVKAGDEWAAVSVTIDARKRGHSQSRSFGYTNRVRIERPRD